MKYSPAHPLTTPIILNDRLQMVDDLSVLPLTITRSADEPEYSDWAQPYIDYTNTKQPTCKGHKNGYNAGAFGKKKK